MEFIQFIIIYLLIQSKIFKKLNESNFPIVLKCSFNKQNIKHDKCQGILENGNQHVEAFSLHVDEIYHTTLEMAKNSNSLEVEAFFDSLPRKYLLYSENHQYLLV